MKYRDYSSVSLIAGVILLAIGFIGGIAIFLNNSDSLIAAIVCAVSGLFLFALFFLISGILEGIADILEKLQNQDNIDY